MIWFNLKELERRIINGEYSDKQGFNYFLAFSIAVVLGASGNISENTSGSIVTFIELLIGVIVTIWGSYMIFNTNKAGDGKDFFKRYFALSWVVGIRLLVFAFILIVPLTVLYFTINTSELGNFDHNTTNYVRMIVSSLFLLIYFLLLNNSFRRVSIK